MGADLNSSVVLKKGQQTEEQVRRWQADVREQIKEQAGTGAVTFLPNKGS